MEYHIKFQKWNRINSNYIKILKVELYNKLTKLGSQ